MAKVGGVVTGVIRATTGVTRDLQGHRTYYSRLWVWQCTCNIDDLYETTHSYTSASFLYTCINGKLALQKAIRV